MRAEKVPRQHRRTPWAPLTERLPTRLSAVDCQPRTITWINARIVTAQASPEADSGAANTKIALLTHPEHPPALCHFQHTSACVIPSITSREQIFLPNDDTGKKNKVRPCVRAHTHTHTLHSQTIKGGVFSVSSSLTLSSSRNTGRSHWRELQEKEWRLVNFKASSLVMYEKLTEYFSACEPQGVAA